MKILIFNLLFISNISWAGWNYGFGKGAYLGQYQMQVEYNSKSQRHHLLTGLGFTQDPIAGEIRQLNLAYQISPLLLEFKDYTWDILRTGLFFTYTDNPTYEFTRYERGSDSKYEDAGSKRWGLLLSSSMQARSWLDRPINISIDGALQERGWVAYEKSPDNPDIMNYFFSLGISIRIPFEKSHSSASESGLR